MLNANYRLTDLKSRTVEPPADWVVDLYHDDKPAPHGVILHALASAIQVAMGLGLGWLIWGGA